MSAFSRRSNKSASKDAASSNMHTLKAGPPARAPAISVQTSRISTLVSIFLKTFLYPIIVFGVPAWPFLAISCAVPIVGVFTVPLFILLTVLLMYSIAWLSYLMLAQDDPPASSVSSVLSPALDSSKPAPSGPVMTKNYLPFLPFSPLRCLKVNWAALQYAATLLRVAVPTVFDWCYRRLMVVGAPNRSGMLVKENILYGSPFPNKRLDVYIPPERPTLAPGDTQQDRQYAQSPSGGETASGEHVRTRKHSTMQFNEPPPARVPASTPVKERAKHGATAGAPGQGSGTTTGAAVIVVLPPVIPPFAWVSKRKTYMQLALRLRRLGYCVVVPDITYFPESRIKESVIDVRIVLRWVGEHIAHYGGDPRRIHLLGHGLSAHLAMLVVVQEGVVLSREAHLDRAWNREQQDAAQVKRRYESWDERAEQEEEEDAQDEGDKVKGTFEEWRRGSVGTERSGYGEKLSANALARLEAELAKQQKGGNGGSENIFSSFSAAQARLASARGEHMLVETNENENDWVDEDSMMPGPPPGLVSLGKEMPADSIAFPTSGSSDRLHDAAAATRARHSHRTGNMTGNTNAHNASSQAPHHARYEPNTLAEAEAQITGGLKKVEIYEPQIAVPPLAGVILLAGVADVIKGWRSEMEKGVEHLSFLRRAMGVSHTACLIHSPAHLLYAAKNIIDTSMLPPKFLLIHGGRDAVVPIEQSTLMKTLLVGLGVEHVKLRCYREMGHVEALASLFLGMGRSLTKYTKQVSHDIQAFVEA